jgi:membrane protein DedA with SNARE-associated domain
LRLAAAIFCINVAGKAGDVFAPTLVGTRPLTLLALNANDLICALTSVRTSFTAWFGVAFARRLVEDPAYFWLGRRHGREGIAWAARRWPRFGSGLAAESAFRRTAALAVVIEPGAVVCALAGAARMHPAWFALLNVLGTAVRLLLLRGAAGLVPPPLQDRALGFVEEQKRALALTALAVVVLPSLAPGLLPVGRWPWTRPECVQAGRKTNVSNT